MHKYVLTNVFFGIIISFRLLYKRKVMINMAKLKKLSGIGEAAVEDNPEYKVIVSVDKKNKKLIISDNGIGMSAEEIDKYINQIAFSGASDFLAKYKDENDKGAQIIGHNHS